MRIGTLGVYANPEGFRRLHWALGPGEDWNFNLLVEFLIELLHWALGPGEDWNTNQSSSELVQMVVALGLRAW